jgi:hypothetical protein
VHEHKNHRSWLKRVHKDVVLEGDEVEAAAQMLTGCIRAGGAASCKQNTQWYF